MIELVDIKCIKCNYKCVSVKIFSIYFIYSFNIYMIDIINLIDDLIRVIEKLLM